MFIIFTICLLVFIAILTIIVSELSDSHFSQAQTMIQEGKYENAVIVLKKELIKNPQDIRVLTSLGECHIQLEEYDTAMKHYMQVHNSNIPLTTKEQININNKMGYLYKELKQYENLFETYLKTLYVSPEDLQANQGVAYNLLGMKQFNASIPYFEKALSIQKNDDIEVFIGYYIALSYDNQTKKAKERIMSMLTKYPDNMHLQLLFTATFQQKSFKDGILYIQKLFDKTNDEGVIRILIKLYSYFLYFVGANPDLIALIKRHVKNKNYSNKLRREAHYFYLFFLIKIERSNIEEIEEEITYFDNNYGNYRNFHQLKNSVDIENKSLDESIQFEDIYKQEMESIISDDFLFNLSGLKSNYALNLEKFFNFSNESDAVAIQLKQEFQRPNIQLLLDRYYKLPGEVFLRFTKRASQLMGLKIMNLLRNTSDDHIDTYLCKDTTTREIIITCFAQCKKSTQLSDIFVGELIAQLKTNKAKKIILISNGELTEAAHSMSKTTPQFIILQDDELHDLLLNTLPLH